MQVSGFRVALALILVTVPETWSSLDVSAQSMQALSPWQRTESQHFEIHYVPALTPELDRVVRSAERAYERICGRLDFALPTKVPLVVFTPSGPMRAEEIRAYAGSGRVAPPSPHRSRLVLPLPEGDAQLDAFIVHELTHLLVSEIIWPGKIGDGGLPHWIKEGVASYMVGAWRDEDERLMRDLVASRKVPALSTLSGSGGFANVRVNGALGHAAFDYLETRWGPNSVRRFLDALIMPRVSKTYEAVFELTPAEFDEVFRQYAERRFGRVGR